MDSPKSLFHGWKILKKVTDQKSWLRKKKSSEKALAANTATNFLICNEEEETEELLTEKAQVQRDNRLLQDKLSSALCWEKVEAEAISLKKDFDKVLQQKAACEERLLHLEAALKECMQQLRFVQEEQEKRVHCALMKKSEKFEKTQITLDEKLAEASKKLVNLDAENAQLNKALSRKDKAIGELRKYKVQAKVDLNALMLRVESAEKENASLKYEVRVLEKELDIRNEEREFNLQTADVAQKEHHENCQRLRLLVQKRLLDPDALTKMKNEVEMLGKGGLETRRRKSKPSLVSSVDSGVYVSVDTPSKWINFPVEKFDATEEENTSLKYALDKKSTGVQFSRIVYPRSASRLSRDLSSGHFKESLKSQTSSERSKQETLSDLGSDEKANTYAESWASILISELEHFRNEKQLEFLEHNTSDTTIFKGQTSMNHPDASDSPQVGFQTSPNKSFISDASDTGNDDNISTAQKIDQNVSASIHKILELLVEINMKTEDNCVSESSRNKNSATPTEYIRRVFQWKTTEFSSVLQQFLKTCNDLLNGTTDVGQFIQLVAFTLDWLTNHCFSLQDMSSMKNAIMTHLDWDESRSESEVDSDQLISLQNLVDKEDMSYLPLNGQHSSFDTKPNVKEEAERLNIQPKKKQCSVMVSEDGLQLQSVKGEDNSSIKRLEETSNDLKIPLKSKISKGVIDDGKPWEKQLRNAHESFRDIDSSFRLGDNYSFRKIGQYAILSLGKQLKAWDALGNAVFFDKVISTQADSVVTSISISTSKRNVSRRLSPLDNMLVEDNNRIDASLRTKDDNYDDIQNGNIDSIVSTNAATESWSKLTDPRDADRKAVILMATVPPKGEQVF
ncbi:hypothetical protein CDL12_03378 [Handroanthus impetiginosus]|uniref:Filament-like plant protein 7 n=1 Tax=Handroanthus impetiginosus TaxID=429701 RepID=A0A2G9I2B1_9LAMI|nr:hypothetical protein CDL12_03378 [Handroanthus impetiginosus]